MKIAIVSFYHRYQEYPTQYSLASLRLHQYISHHGFDSQIVPFYLDQDNIDIAIKELSDQLSKFDIIGLSSYHWTKKYVKEISSLLKIKNNKSQVIIGGPEAENVNPNEWENEIFVVGEGENSLMQTINYIKRGKKDLLFFQENTNIFDKNNPANEKIETEIPCFKSLFSGLSFYDRSFAWYETNRGCSYSCGYCGHKTRNKVAFFNDKIIEDEIKQIGTIGFEKVFVIDPNFGGNKEKGKQILKKFHQFAPDSKLTIYLRPEFIDDEYINLLKKTKLAEVRIGIQTINENVPMWVRFNSMKHVRQELPKLSQNNIEWKAELIVGLPGDNVNGLLHSIDFVENSLKPFSYMCYHLTIIKNTKINKLVNNFSNPLWLKIDQDRKVKEASTYSSNELQLMLDISKEKVLKYNHR